MNYLADCAEIEKNIELGILLIVGLDKLFPNSTSYLRFFQNKHIPPFNFLMQILCTTGSLHCGIFRYSVTHIYICPCTVDRSNCVTCQ